jgi:hypothetical protein
MNNLACRSLFRSARAPLGSLVAALALLLPAIPARATTVIAPSFDELVAKADYIVRATVKSVTAEYRTTPRGQAIFTKVELQVLETIAGTPPSPLVLEHLGGSIGDVTMRVDGVPLFRVGNEDILFVQANGKQYYPLVGIMHGKYPVKRDAKTGAAIVTRSNGAPLRDVREIRGDLEPITTAPAPVAGSAPLTPEAFAGKIRESYHAQFPNRTQLEK